MRHNDNWRYQAISLIENGRPSSMIAIARLQQTDGAVPRDCVALNFCFPALPPGLSHFAATRLEMRLVSGWHAIT